MSIQSVNPATEEVLRKFEPLSKDEIERKLAQAEEAFRSYRRVSVPQRAAWMNQAADILDSDRQRWGRLITLEMGKTFKSSVEEVEKCARTCRYYAQNAERFLRDEQVPTEADESYVRFEPVGPILAVMPWNFPFWQVFRFAAPALMAGNVGLLKHASNVPQCALAIEEIFEKAGFPTGVFQALLITGEQADEILGDPRVRAATLTGSEATGSIVAATAGKKLKKTVLELGGSDPFVVMPSADLEQAVELAVKSRMRNTGQACNAAKRFILDRAIADEFLGKFVDQVSALRAGDPFDPSVDIGPLSSRQGREAIEKQVRESVAAGARILTGGRRIERKGYFFEPTVISHVTPKAPTYCEEVFGPVALVFTVSGLDEAISVANDVEYGLGASLWSQDPREHELFIDRIEAGQCFINDMVTSDPRLPFGGVKHSGYGRELSHFGLQEFVNVKTVWIRSGGKAALKRTGTE